MKSIMRSRGCHREADQFIAISRPEVGEHLAQMAASSVVICFEVSC